MQILIAARSTKDFYRIIILISPFIIWFKPIKERRPSEIQTKGKTNSKCHSPRGTKAKKIKNASLDEKNVFQETKKERKTESLKY